MTIKAQNSEHQDDRVEAMLRRWAADKFKLTDVTKVVFELGAHGPYSDVTPDVDPYLEVCVLAADGWHHYDDYHYNTDPIRDILQYATEHAPARSPVPPWRLARHDDPELPLQPKQRPYTEEDFG